MTGWRKALAWVALLLPLPAAAHVQATQAQPSPPPPPDPLTVSIITEDAERFAALFKATGGKPNAEQIQHDYLDKGSYGISVFTPGRIENAVKLASTIAKDPSRYEKAIRECLPRVQAANADLRSIYLGLSGLFPDQPLPHVYMVFGAGNSGGTASASAQVLGLEVICADNPTPEKFRAALRYFFAHETVHSLQRESAKGDASPLLNAMLAEGAADFIATLVTGEEQASERAQWALPREQALWAALSADLAKPEPPTQHWIYNYQSAPEGWPSDVGYWIGMRIWQNYYDKAADKRQAVRDMLGWDDPRFILERSGYANVPKLNGSL